MNPLWEEYRDFASGLTEDTPKNPFDTMLKLSRAKDIINALISDIEVKENILVELQERDE
jgi:hypothetical protein